MTVGPANTSLPSALTSLTRQLPPGWRHRATPGTGHVTRQRIDNHKQVLIQQPCISVALRLRHDDGRAAVGIWVQPDGGRWAFDDGWGWTVCDEPACPYGPDHPGELPRPLDVAQLRAWVTATTPEQYEAAVIELAAKRAAAAAKAAATRAGKRAAATEISTSVAA